MSDKLTTALQKLAISPVKADRLAICRLEKEYGASFSTSGSENIIKVICLAKRKATR